MQIRIADARRTESGLQAHPLIFLKLQTLSVCPNIWHTSLATFRTLRIKHGLATAGLNLD
jgi:hypothetical protein